MQSDMKCWTREDNRRVASGLHVFEKLGRESLAPEAHWPADAVESILRTMTGQHSEVPLR
jgi:hypothetical protein